MSFLPDNYTPPKGSSYFKPQPGENRLRILSDAVIGNVGWKTNKDGGRVPVRTRVGEPLPKDCEDIKHFWAVVIYDVAAKEVKVWEITQASIRDAIYALAQDEDWGDPKSYGLTLKKEGSGMETKYTLHPAPKKPLSDEIIDAREATPVNLEALFDNGDPFACGEERSPFLEDEEEDDGINF